MDTLLHPDPRPADGHSECHPLLYVHFNPFRNAQPHGFLHPVHHAFQHPFGNFNRFLYGHGDGFSNRHAVADVYSDTERDFVADSIFDVHPNQFGDR